MNTTSYSVTPDLVNELNKINREDISEAFLELYGTHSRTAVIDFYLYAKRAIKLHSLMQKAVRRPMGTEHIPYPVLKLNGYSTDALSNYFEFLETL